MLCYVAGQVYFELRTTGSEQVVVVVVAAVGIVVAAVVVVVIVVVAKAIVFIIGIIIWHSINKVPIDLPEAVTLLLVAQFDR